MLRLKATKTSLYKLVAEYTTLPGIRRVEFVKAYREPDFWLKWRTEGDQVGDYAEAFLAACLGKPQLSITVRDFDGHEVSRVVHTLTVEQLRERNLLENFTTAAERRRAEKTCPE